MIEGEEEGDASCLWLTSRKATEINVTPWGFSPSSGHTTLLLAVNSRRPSVQQSSSRTARDLWWTVSSLAAYMGSLTAVWNGGSGVDGWWRREKSGGLSRSTCLLFIEASGSQNWRYPSLIFVWKSSARRPLTSKMWLMIYTREHACVCLFLLLSCLSLYWSTRKSHNRLREPIDFFI